MVCLLVTATAAPGGCRAREGAPTEQAGAALGRPGAGLPPDSLQVVASAYSSAYAGFKAADHRRADAAIDGARTAAGGRRRLLERQADQICQRQNRLPVAQHPALDDSVRRLRQASADLSALIETEKRQAATEADKTLRAAQARLRAVEQRARPIVAGLMGGHRFALNGTTYVAYVADLRTEDVTLHLGDSLTNSKLTTLEALRASLADRGQEPLMLTNAGMFDPAQNPVGLYIEGGTTLFGLNEKAPATDENFFLKPNGVFFIDRTGAAHIDTTEEYARTWRARQAREVQVATQSGPMLVINGRLHPKFGLHSNNAKVRSGVGLQPASGTNGARLIFLTTETGSTFYDFATVFRDLFNCPNALFLDGAISKMYLKNQPTAYTNGYFGPLLAVVPKNSPRRAPKRKARPKTVAPAPTSIPTPAADPFAEPAPVGGGKPGRNKAPAAPAPLPVTPAPADSVATPPRRP